MNWTLLALTLAPGLSILYWIYLKDRYEKEPVWQVIKVFLGGALVTVPVIIANDFWQNAGFGISDSVRETAIYAFVSVGMTEELSKLLMVLSLVYFRKSFNEPFDGIVYCVAASMGFATAENFLYVYLHSAPEEAYWVAMVRMFTAVPAHATFAILMGFMLGVSKFHPLRWPLIMLALFLASLFHGAYDFFLFLRNIPGISIGAFVSLFIGIRLARRALQINRRLSPFRND